MNLQALLLKTLLMVAPPGHTNFSVVPVDCHESCSTYKWSSFYNSYVKKESVEEGTLRYETIAKSIVKTAQQKLCLDDNLIAIPDCKKEIKGWTFVDLVSVVSGSMIAESGLREDVQVGRGRSGHTKKTDPLTDDAGGQGRGPGNEVCLIQIHPLVLSKLNVVPTTFLGLDDQSLNNCFGFGMTMFARARSMCSYRAIKEPEITHDWVFETYSLYGTGITCSSANGGKTSYRRNLYSIISSDFGSRVNKEKKLENANRTKSL